MTPSPSVGVSLGVVARDWGRIGATSFGGPPAQIHLLRALCVEKEGWLSSEEFEHALATTNLMPGPAGTQMALYCAWRVAGSWGLVIGGLSFILPGLILIIALGAAVLALGAPKLLLAATLGASAAIPAVALRAGLDLLAPSRRSTRNAVRWLIYVILGALGTVFLGPLLIAVLLSCGLAELLAERIALRPPRTMKSIVGVSLGAGALGPLAWTALKVGALSFGGGFVIIPLIQADAVNRHHWMTKPAFLAAVALGQITPGPIVQTIAVVGWAAAGLGGALLAAAIAFAPSFLLIYFGGPRFEAIRQSTVASAFLAGAGPAAIGAILGTIPLLARGIVHLWQIPLTLLATLALLAPRRNVALTIVVSAVLGALLSLLGLPSNL